MMVSVFATEDVLQFLIAYDHYNAVIIVDGDEKTEQRLPSRDTSPTGSEAVAVAGSGTFSFCDSRPSVVDVLCLIMILLFTRWQTIQCISASSRYMYFNEITYLLYISLFNI